ncbi:MAG: precorrin-2 C(20)-methyltransferase [Prevotella sp.]|uniref:precorrin-2 C(20)-methyltransferase n=1 Tax=Prevotella sp. TaxID=59823 RepID=UPI002A34AA3F|nr:precorrin-2 C(20)-methyltransferase [Prevotella sp.]MDD7318262.1 precorrin-2 C(20)-methyltransferase [Prevotellaceae bacterium]MDY4019734.1 precorrin-2 C(20)-methyltransferase [Prevotella sp.]
MDKHPICFASLGPGDPELMTLKTLNSLRSADIIFVPSTIDREGRHSSRAAEIVTANVPDAPIHTFHLPMSRNRDAAMSAYSGVYDAAISAWQEGKRVVIGVEGDVSIYASIHYVMDRMMSEGVAVEQLPGIPSFIAAAGEACLSLISQQEKLLVMPGFKSKSMLTRALDSGCVVAVMKLSGCEKMMKNYIHEHPENTYYYIENASNAAAYHTTDRKQIANLPFPYFSLMIIRRKVSASPGNDYV